MSTPLPEALAPWRDWLGWFDADRIPQLGDWLMRLQPLLGRYQGRDPGGMPEPDGLDGVQRRGHYERLLSSEWLLADEVPDEFLRRAAVGEHLFLAPRPRARKAARNITVLFDAGPWQLGAPRLVHLVMWILLARRAAELDAQLQWGILQQPASLYPAGTAEDLQRMLRARGFSVVDEPALQQWQSELHADTGEVWLLGPAHVQQQAASLDMYTHALSIGSNAACDGLQLGLLEPAGERALLLPLPDDDIAGRLLRGAFLQPAQPERHHQGKHRFSSSRPPVVSSGGHHVAIMLSSAHALQIFTLPQREGQALKSRAQQMSATAEVLALVMHGKRVGALIRKAKALQAWEFPGLPATLPQPGIDEFQAPPGRAVYLPAAYLRDGHEHALYVQDTGGRLQRWGTEVTGNAMSVDRHLRPDIKLTLQQEQVLALQMITDRELAYLWRHASGQVYFQRGNPHGRNQTKMLVGVFPDNVRVLLAAAPATGWRGLFTGCATCDVESGAESWQLHPAGSAIQPEHRGLATSVQLQPGWTARALVADASHDGALALLIQSPNRQAIALWCNDKIEALHVAQSPIRHLTVSADGSTVAMLTDDPELIVYSLTTREIRATISGRGDA